jgi:nitroreductase
MSDLISKLEWRYATKKFDPSQVVSQDKIDFILEAIRLSATSSGLQPYEVLVITNKAIREQIKQVAWNQGQVTDSSHLTNDIRGFKNEGWENYRASLLNTYPQRDAETNYQHAARQAYIGLGSALIAAAELKVDSTPMEGFDPVKVDEILGLKEKGLRSVLLLPLGYRADESDWLVKLQKVRRSREQFVTEIN